MTQSCKPKSWRDVLRVHPAAELFPIMPLDELRALGEDIKKNGLHEGVAILDDQLLDGRNRLDAMELVGIKLVTGNGQIEWANVPSRNVKGVDPVTFVISKNVRRRHLSTEQKRDLVAELLKATPEKSNREIAATVKVDHKTVAAVRTAKERTGEIPQLAKTVGKDGKQRKSPARAQRPKKDKVPAVIIAPDRTEAPAESEGGPAPQPVPPPPLSPPPADIVECSAAPISSAIRKALEDMTRADSLRLITALLNELRQIETRYRDNEAPTPTSLPMSKTPEFERRLKDV
jgi:hypothetical protein